MSKKPNHAITSREVILDTIKFMEFAAHHRTCSYKDVKCNCGRDTLIAKLERWEKRNGM